MHDGRADLPPFTGEEVRALLAEPEKIALVAQPIVDVKRAVVTGYELLARFALGRPAPPDKVFAAAARLGLGAELEATVIARALDVAATRPANCFITINVDPLHILSTEVKALLDRPESFRGLVFEMTEQHAIRDVKALRTTLDSLRERGALIAIDDAGAGYSGLKQIIDLQPQLLKVDRDLVTGIHRNEAKRALVQMLGELAGRLDAWVLAEGIEDDEEAATLVQLACRSCKATSSVGPRPRGAGSTRPRRRSCGSSRGTPSPRARRSMISSSDASSSRATSPGPSGRGAPCASTRRDARSACASSGKMARASGPGPSSCV
ncbi:MAG: EAL domain-containing protein [Labilithrix sp.]